MCGWASGRSEVGVSRCSGGALVTAVVLMYAGEGCSVFAVLFSAHPAANARKTREMIGADFLVLIAWREWLPVTPQKSIRPLSLGLPWGFAPSDSETFSKFDSGLPSSTTAFDQATTHGLISI